MILVPLTVKQIHSMQKPAAPFAPQDEGDSGKKYKADKQKAETKS